MSNQIMDTQKTTAIVPEIWSAKYYQVLLDRLPFIDSVDRSYDGEIQELGDIVNISSIPEFSDATLLAEGASGDADAVEVTGQQLVINSRVYKDVIVTKKSKLQSLSFMDELRDKMIFAINKKIQALIIQNIIPSAATPDHQIAYDSGSTLALADILEAKELLDTQNVAEENRVSVMSAAQWNDIFNINSFTSRDFIPAGSPITSGSLPTPICGFMPKMTNVVLNTSYWYHPTFLTMAIQDALNIEVFNLGVDGVRGTRINADVLLGIRQLDSKRIVSIA